MDYRLTEHARDALEKRRVRLEWVEKALSPPEWTEKDVVDSELEHRLTRIEEFGGRILRVIVNTHAVPPRVVTAYFDQRRLNR
ncbi:MAG: DUF4258 domain-containing protein [Sedimentisphaerales bacterium]|nr:DUF4258 domain-containing protein [Sedimentisphaerales bacterium]